MLFVKCVERLEVIDLRSISYADKVFKVRSRYPQYNARRERERVEPQGGNPSAFEIYRITDILYQSKQERKEKKKKRFSAIVDSVYRRRLTARDMNIENNEKRCFLQSESARGDERVSRFTRNDLNATSLEFGRMMPGSTRRRNSVRWS